MKKVGGNPQILHSAESEENKKTRLSHILIFQFAIWVIAITMLESFFWKTFLKKEYFEESSNAFLYGFPKEFIEPRLPELYKTIFTSRTTQCNLRPCYSRYNRVDKFRFFLQNANVVAVYSFLMERWQLDEINCLVVSTKNAKKCIFATPWYPKIPQKVYMKILNASPCNRENADIRFKNVKKMGFVR